jgi:hypothetical protein
MSLPRNKALTYRVEGVARTHCAASPPPERQRGPLGDPLTWALVAFDDTWRTAHSRENAGKRDQAVSGRGDTAAFAAPT